MVNINTGKRMCIGCGICGGVCDYITMSTDSMGAIRPKVDIAKCTNCGKCIEVCPFSESVKDEDQIGEMLYGGQESVKHRQETGYYLSCYEGYVEKFRYSSASGGMATCFLEKCLSEHVVDEVVCVSSCNEHNKLFKYVFVRDPILLRKCSGSAYYPVEISDVLKRIRNSNKKVAIIALPCVVKAIRLVSQCDKYIMENVKILVALTCGGLPKKAMVDYVAIKNNINMNKIKYLKFRKKDTKFLNKNYSMTIALNDGTKVISRLHGESFGFAFLNKLFHNLACGCCDDVFGECADITFMDAWLAKYSQDTLGNSIAITRSPITESVMNSMLEENNTINRVRIENAIVSQNNVGLIVRKKTESYYRTKFYRLIGYKVGDKRFVKVTLKRRIIAFVRAILEYRVYRKCLVTWQRVMEEKISIQEFDKIITKSIDRNIKLFRRKKT